MTTIVVIGAGPAACAAAITLHRLGRRVMLVADTLPTRGPVIDSLSPLASLAFEELGLKPHDALGQSVVGGYEWIERNGRIQRIGRHPDCVGWHVDRALLDASLLANAERMGVEVLRGHVSNLRPRDRGFQMRVGGQQIDAAWLVDGSGKAELATRSLGLAQQMTSERQYVWRGVEANPSHLCAGPSFTQGQSSWSWRAPLYDGRVAWTWSGPGRPPLDWGECSGFDMTWRLTRPCATERLRLVGDAACCVDARNGHGLVFAFLSGVAAARSISAAMAQPHEEGLLAAAFDAAIASDFDYRCASLSALIT